MTGTDNEALHSYAERLLGSAADLRPEDVGERAEVTMAVARRFWHALGFPNAEDDDVVFTDADVAALTGALKLVDEGHIDEATALATTRAFARTTDRLAVWQTQLMAEALGSPSEVVDDEETDTRAVTDIEVARAAAGRLVDLADDLEPLLVYAWRRHLAHAIDRMLSDADPSDERAPGIPIRAVGFADLVNFTALVRRLTERQLAHLVQRFELMASDIVTAHGGRVIKTVGDEVLYVHQDASAGAAIALDLVDAMSDDAFLPDVRVAMAYGPVLSRLGDIFGTTVNRASRLTAVTPPGRVYVDDAAAAALRSISGFRTSPRRRRTLRGIGSVTPSELGRASGARPGAGEGASPLPSVHDPRPSGRG